MDLPWARHRSLQLSPTKCLRSAASGGRSTNVGGRLRQMSGQKKPGVKGRSQKSIAQDLRCTSGHFLGDSAKFSTSPLKGPAFQKVEAGKASAAQRFILGGQQERGSSVVTWARKQPMPQGTYIKNPQFRKPKTTPSNSEYLEDEGWGTEGFLEETLEVEEADVSSDESDDGEGAPGVRRLERRLSLDSLDTDEIENSDGDSGVEGSVLVRPQRPRRSYTELQSEEVGHDSGTQQKDRGRVPERPRRVYREITPLGEFIEDAEEKQRRLMKERGHVQGTAFGIKTPVTDGPIGRKLGLVEEGVSNGEQLEDEEEEYQGKRVVLERVPGARRKATEEDALPPKAQTKEEFDRLYEEYLQREEEKRAEAKRQKALFEEERKERIRLIDIEREKRKAELARVGITEDKKFDIPSETIERIQRLKGREKREAWVAAWKRIRKLENREKHKVRQSKAALQKEAEEYLHLAMQKLIGGDITRVRGRTAMDIIANTMAGRLGDALPANQRSLLEDIPPLPVNYRTVEEQAQKALTSTYIEQYRPEGETGQGLKSVVNPRREPDTKLAQEKRLPSVNLESAALFGRGSDLEVESEVQARIAADLARLDREVQLELAGGAESSGFEGEEARVGNEPGAGGLESFDSSVAEEPRSGGGLGTGVRGSDPQSGSDTDSDTDDRRDASGTAGSSGQVSSADDSDSDDDDIKKIGEDLFPDYDGTSSGGPITSAFANELLTTVPSDGLRAEESSGQMASQETVPALASDGRAVPEPSEDLDPDDIRAIGEDLFRAYDPNVSINDMAKVLSRSIAQHSGYRKLTVAPLADSMPEAKTLNQFLQTLSFKTHEIEARIRKASADQAIRVSRRRHAEKAEADQQFRRQLMARGGGDFWEAAGKYPAGPKGETFAKTYDKARSKVPVGAVAAQSAGAEAVSGSATGLATKLAPVEDFQIPPGRTVIRVGANECLECEGVNKDGSKCVRLVTVKDIAKYGGRIMCWQHR